MLKPLIDLELSPGAQLGVLKHPYIYRFKPPAEKGMAGASFTSQASRVILERLIFIICPYKAK
jgi:hypothetical protein